MEQALLNRPDVIELQTAAPVDQMQALADAAMSSMLMVDTLSLDRTSYSPTGESYDMGQAYVEDKAAKILKGVTAVNLAVTGLSYGDLRPLAVLDQQRRVVEDSLNNKRDEEDDDEDA